MKKLATALLAAALATTLAAPSSAHHAVNAQFDVSRLVPMKGVLTGIDNLNPHAYWHFDVKAANGSVQRWNIESVAPVALRRAGLRMKDDIKVGDTYSFQIAPSRNGSPTGLLIILTVNGKDIRLTPV